jgi:hypothetical protein
MPELCCLAGLVKVRLSMRCPVCSSTLEKRLSHASPGNVCRGHWQLDEQESYSCRWEDKMARAVRAHSKPSRRAMKPKRRQCLRCERMFLSEGPHNRLCQSCREFLAASPTPAEEYPLGYL